MFEQATLTNGPAGERVWTTFLGLTSQVALVSFAALAPMVWPQVLPVTRFWESLAPPMPPGPKPLGNEIKRVTRVRALKPGLWALEKYEPRSIPTQVYQLIEAPDAGPTVVGALPGDNSGPGDVVGGILSNLAANTARVAPPHVTAPATKPAPEPTPAIQRYVQGGNVHLGQPLFKAAPEYPATARAAHISGDVKLECVVGIDGHIHEVKIVSGNPLLVHAAVAAAWQWVYAPSKLNGTPIEIVTILTFSFKLN